MDLFDQKPIGTSRNREVKPGTTTRKAKNHDLKCQSSSHKLLQRQKAPGSVTIIPHVVGIEKFVVTTATIVHGACLHQDFESGVIS